jgi:hypothetical protein
LNFLSELFKNNNIPPVRKPKKKRSTEGGKTSVNSKAEKLIWHINGQDFPVELHRERRWSWRYTFGKNKLIIRIPQVDILTEKKILDDVQNSLKTKTVNKPNLLNRYESRTYTNGETLNVGIKSYYLSIKKEDRKTATAKLLLNKTIQVILPLNLTEQKLQEHTSTLLSRVVAQDFLPEFTRRVNELNHLFFKKTVKSVNFKYNHSNWGSCSSSGNLNFSTRLLFAPEDVQDYVIIHELAHLIELNHSDRFWKLIGDAMPDFAKKEKWLKKNGHLCRF